MLKLMVLIPPCGGLESYGETILRCIGMDLRNT